MRVALRKDLAVASNGYDFIPNYVQTDETRSLLRVEVTAHCILGGCLEFVKAISLCVDRMPQSSSSVAAFWSLLHEEDDLAFSRRSHELL